ncbi:MAG: VTC domain-containing protein, partial [Oscillospiraceae bacterium]|nr:VTC domain-containing protein [Oscillospiraceae bacterium]
DWMQSSGEALICELYSKMQTQRLAPKTIVDYMREPFVCDAGNVRVTIDYDIRTALGCTGFLSADCATIPAGDSVILEVKWDEFLPDTIRSIIQLDGRHSAAFSKYAQCRIYG